jgi:hypothetical protein
MFNLRERYNFTPSIQIPVFAGGSNKTASDNAISDDKNLDIPDGFKLVSKDEWEKIKPLSFIKYMKSNGAIVDGGYLRRVDEKDGHKYFVIHNVSHSVNRQQTPGYISWTVLFSSISKVFIRLNKVSRNELEDYESKLINSMNYGNSIKTEPVNSMSNPMSNYTNTMSNPISNPMSNPMSNYTNPMSNYTNPDSELEIALIKTENENLKKKMDELINVVKKLRYDLHTLAVNYIRLENHIKYQKSIDK